MSTRASVKVFEGNHELYFYQHSDGYSDGLGETLKEFLSSAKAISQKGDIEYFCGVMLMEVNRDYIERKLSLPDLMPAVGVHGDEDYQYVIDCDNLTMEILKI